jgi:hypothetical protein
LLLDPSPPEGLSPMPLPEEAATAEHLRLGEVEVVGRMPWSSNGTYLCDVVHEGRTRRAIYKPRSRERELWDFPSGLHQREVAAYELSRLLGWDLVPVTVDRDGRILGIDHGLMFHHEFKLRTVIWEFGGEPVPDVLLEDLASLIEPGALPDRVARLLDPFERDAVIARAQAMIDNGYFPIDETGRRYPWPLV